MLDAACGDRSNGDHGSRAADALQMIRQKTLIAVEPRVTGDVGFVNTLSPPPSLGGRSRPGLTHHVAFGAVSAHKVPYELPLPTSLGCYPIAQTLPALSAPDLYLTELTFG